MSLRRRLRAPSIRNKLLRIHLGAGGAAFCAVTVLLLAREYVAQRHALLLDLQVQARIIGANSTAALLFDSPSDATDTLGAVRASPNIVSACIYTASGAAFACYPQQPAAEEPLPAFGRPYARFTWKHLDVVEPIEVEGRRLGLIHLRSSLRSLYTALGWGVAVICGVSLVVLGGVLALSLRLQRNVTEPIVRLAQVMEDVSRRGDYQVRADATSGDEVGVLARAFNEMLDQIDRRDRKLRELDRLKSELVANVGHELRTPLTAIRGYVEYLLVGGLGQPADSHGRALTVIERNAKRLSHVIDELLDLSRLEAGQMRLDVRRFQVAEVLHEVAANFRTQVAEKQLTLDVLSHAELPCVLGDPHRITQVIDNLVANALKFTPAGGRITVCAEPFADDGRRGIEVRVSDTGIGIPASKIDSIFGRFYQVDGSSARRFGGIGLGLAIVQGILAAHGTRAQVESVEGQGTTVAFLLATAEVNPAAEA